MATTLLDASPLAQVARHWAHVRYCATLTTNRELLALSDHGSNVVYHHKVMQSEQLGIGLALVVAKNLLARQYPGWDFHAVDAEMALKAGFLEGAGSVRTASKTQKRPDYILLGHHSSGRRSGFKILVLECKGTHQSPGFAYGQLARAAVQVDALRVGGRAQPSLMVASFLSRTRITSYVLDPPGDDELWSGADDELDELLRTRPDDKDWRPRPAAPDDAGRWELPADDADDLPASAGDVPPDEDLPPGAPDVFDIPAEQRGWFTQILARASAATALLFAGNNAAARDYATPRQREDPAAPEPLTLFELAPAWTTSTASTLTLPNGMRAEGTRYHAPLPAGRVLEVFRGVESDLYRHLAEGRIGPYLRAAPRAFRRWSAAQLDGGVMSVGRDGTVLVVRLAGEQR
ncbi:hypothetical protein [Micromonospora maris]|uniref:hypothetical protein n=1 Tax=Micromonospora maris TaxID=1003110 RepID=UPI002E12FB34|nr:hypothetical protein OG712_19600 [Micromonospora maris]